METKTSIQYYNLIYLIDSICEHKKSILESCNKSLSYVKNFTNEELLNIEEVDRLLSELKNLQKKLDSNLNEIDSLTRNNITTSYKAIADTFTSYIKSSF